MSGIFINYRSAENSYAAPLLDDHLRMAFGDENVYKDSRSNEAGDVFPQKLRSTLMSSQVVLALIGRNWLALEDESGARLIDRPGDWVRQELEAALLAGIRVIPVLLDEAGLPRVDQLPPSLQTLPTRQSMHLRQRESGIDLPVIARELSKWVRPKKTEPPLDERRRGNFGPDGVHFERGGTYIENFNGTGDIVSGDKNVYGGTP